MWFLATAVWLAFQWQPVVVAAVGGVGLYVTAAISWLVARRRESGTTSTSDAATLWEAAEQIRIELREEVVRTRETEAGLRERIAVLEVEQENLRGCRERVAVLEHEIDRLTRLVEEQKR